jgi:hypothetical protein
MNSPRNLIEISGVEDEVVVPSKRPQTVYIEMEKENNAIYTSGLSNEEEMGQDGKALMMSLLKQVRQRTWSRDLTTVYRLRSAWIYRG